jgi:hypothetical protein
MCVKEDVCVCVKGGYVCKEGVRVCMCACVCVNICMLVTVMIVSNRNSFMISFFILSYL